MSNPVRPPASERSNRSGSIAPVTPLRPTTPAPDRDSGGGRRRRGWQAARRAAVREMKRDQGLWVWAGAALVLAATFFAAAGVAANW
jgi:hypothetical protein